MAGIEYMGKPVAGSIPIDDTDINIHKVWSSQRVDGGMWYELGPATLTNGIVVFDDLNPNFEYKLSWNTVGADGIDVQGTVNEPWVKYFTKEAGTHSTEANPTIKLTYYIGGGTNDVSRFALKYNKGAYGSFTSTQEGYAPTIIINDIGVREVATGITGVVARKSGHVVTLAVTVGNITASNPGWYALGTLPQELRPPMQIRFAGFDNATSSYKINTAIPFVIYTSGVLSVYFFSDKLTAAPHGTITYITD